MTERPTSGAPDWNTRLIRMANDIARNFAAIGHEHAAAATADHIAHFWDRRMKARLFEVCHEGDCPLSPIARSALQRLRDRGAPPPQTQATESSTGASDAG